MQKIKVWKIEFTFDIQEELTFWQIRKITPFYKKMQEWDMEATFDVVRLLKIQESDIEKMDDLKMSELKELFDKLSEIISGEKKIEK